jgi:hypothetical protein
VPVFFRGRFLIVLCHLTQCLGEEVPSLSGEIVDAILIDIANMTASVRNPPHGIPSPTTVLCLNMVTSSRAWFWCVLGLALVELKEFVA